MYLDHFLGLLRLYFEPSMDRSYFTEVLPQTVDLSGRLNVDLSDSIWQDLSDSRLSTQFPVRADTCFCHQDIIWNCHNWHSYSGDGFFIVDPMINMTRNDDSDADDDDDRTHRQRLPDEGRNRTHAHVFNSVCLLPILPNLPKLPFLGFLNLNMTEKWQTISQSGPGKGEVIHKISDLFTPFLTSILQH